MQGVLRLSAVLATSAVACSLLSACGGSDGANGSVPPSPTDQSYSQPPGASRTWLTVAALTGAQSTPNAPLNNGYFMPIGTPAAAGLAFSGTIHLKSFSLATDDLSAAADDVDLVFPNVDLQFVSDGSGDLIPVNRGILVGTNTTASRLILGPGTVWSESGDNGWSRASFPFEIVAPLWNLTRNGLATFVYNTSEVSAVRVQLTQESSGAPTLSDIWGTLQATYLPQNIAGSDALVTAFQAEKAGYLPVKPWTDAPAPLVSGTTTFNGGFGDEMLSYMGIVQNGVIYLQPCQTRSGAYPYCTQMRAGAFSATKSMAAAVALLRLAEKYGDGVGDLLIKDYVNVTATNNGWDTVTFLDALNMATGIGINSPNVPVGTGCCMFDDENTAFMNQAFGAGGKDAILAAAFKQNAYSWGPGVEVRYDSLHTFILGAAMDAYLKQQEGPSADLGDMLVNEVYKPIGIANTPMMRTIETDGSRGLVYLDVGLYPTADDTAKIAQLLQNGGSFGGQQLLSPGLTAIALYRTANQGLRGYQPWDNMYGEHRYLMAFHSVPWSDGAGCTVRVPNMSGLGGNLVAILPNGVIAFRYAHSGVYDTTPMISAAASVGPMCP